MCNCNNPGAALLASSQLPTFGDLYVTDSEPQALEPVAVVASPAFPWWVVLLGVGLTLALVD